MTLQAICDADMKFMDVFTGTPGRIHDSRVLQLSDISSELPNICGEQYHLIGDGGYAIRPWLLIPYRNYGHFTEEQRNFNNRLCATRVTIERAFGLLKCRFRQLMYGVLMNKVLKIGIFIICCCVLHNLCIENGDFDHIFGDAAEIDNVMIPELDNNDQY